MSRACLAGQAFAWVLIGWGVLLFLSHNWLGGMWSVLIGIFLNGAAKSGYQEVLVRQALEGEPVRRFMNPHPIVVPPSLTWDRSMTSRSVNGGSCRWKWFKKTAGKKPGSGMESGCGETAKHAKK